MGVVDGRSVVIGVAVGVAWLVATQIGVRAIAAVVPSIVDRAGDLYRIAAGDRRRDIALAVIAMVLAEELAFRAMIHVGTGLYVGVMADTFVKVVERNWELVLAGAACGVVFGVVYQWTGGIVARLLAHLVWTGSLLLIGALQECRGVPCPPRPRSHSADAFVVHLRTMAQTF